MGKSSNGQLAGAPEFVKFVLKSLTTDKGIHAETAVAASARMAGTFLFRSFAFPLAGIKPGQAVLSDAANEQGPKLVEILGSTLNQVDIYLNKKNLDAVDEKSKKPLLDFLETQKKLEPGMITIKDRWKLSNQEAAESVAMCTGLIIKQCNQVLDPHIAFKIAVYGFIEGAKTAPAPVKI